MFRYRLEAAQQENARDAERRAASEENSQLRQEFYKLQQQLSTAEEETAKAKETEDRMRIALAQMKEEEEAMEGVRYGGEWGFHLNYYLI